MFTWTRKYFHLWSFNIYLLIFVDIFYFQIISNMNSIRRIYLNTNLIRNLCAKKNVCVLNGVELKNNTPWMMNKVCLFHWIKFRSNDRSFYIKLNHFFFFRAILMIIWIDGGKQVNKSQQVIFVFIWIDRLSNIYIWKVYGNFSYRALMVWMYWLE